MIWIDKHRQQITYRGSSMNMCNPKILEKKKSKSWKKNKLK